MNPVIRLLRPEQWLKNFFIFAPLIFSKHLFELNFLGLALEAFLIFSLLSSTVYVFNDIGDREVDRSHPTKRNRPIASGAISVRKGVFIALGLLIAVVVLLSAQNVRFILIAAFYLIMNLAYSFFLKRVMLVDVFIVAAGFMLRVLAGAYAIDVQVSEWLILCTLFVSLFLSISKRRGELLLVMNSEDFQGRPGLMVYDVQFLDQMMTIAASGMAISYALYTVAERTILVFGTTNLIFTTVFVLFGIFRYLHLIRSKKTEDNPTHMLTTDLVTLINGAAWFVTCVVIIYLADIKHWLGIS